MKKHIIIVILTLLTVVMGYFGVQSYAAAKIYEQNTQKLVLDKRAGEQAEFQAKAWVEKLSLGYYTNDKRLIREQIEQERQEARQAANRYMLYAMATLAMILLSYVVTDLRLFTFFGGLAALVLLYFGLFTPILMVTIHKEVEYIGDVVFSFESKSLLGSVVKLWDGEEKTVALVILLFSVLVPLIKTSSMMFVSIVIQSSFAHGIVKFFKMIGKWSMLDVFVVAVLLVYLTGSGSDVSQAEVQAGLYFFLAYVIVSMLVSLSADKMLERAR